MHCLLGLYWAVQGSPTNTPSVRIYTHARCELHATVRPNKSIPPTSPTTDATINSTLTCGSCHAPSSSGSEVQPPPGTSFRSATTFLLSTSQPLRSRSTFHIRNSPCFPRACPCRLPCLPQYQAGDLLSFPRLLGSSSILLLPYLSELQLQQANLWPEHHPWRFPKTLFISPCLPTYLPCRLTGVGTSTPQVCLVPETSLSVLSLYLIG